MIRPIFKFFMLLSKLGSKAEFLHKLVVKFPLTNKIYHFIYNNLKPKRIVVIKVQGSKIIVDPRHDICLGLWETGFYEKTETRIVQEYIKDGMVVVDLGANIGYYSLLTARSVGPTGKVYAFEPAPKNYAMLIKNIEINGYTNITPIQKAVSNKNGVASLFIDTQYSGSHRLKNSMDKEDIIEVSVITLDDFFRDKGYKVDLIKMDIEGAELFALEGMQRILNENKELVIISEFNPHLLKLLGVRPEDYLNKLVENGFKIYEIDDKNETIHDADLAKIAQVVKIRSDYLYTNILCKRELGFQ